MQVKYLSREQILAIHEVVLETHGGLDGILSKDALESAIQMPSCTAFGEEAYPTLLSKAAAYLFFITSNHGFRDGNKRTALAASFEFLASNGLPLDIPPKRWSDAETLVLNIAAGNLSRKEATQQFQEFVRSL
jgi:death-on-curing protein